MDSGFLQEGESLQAEYDCASTLSPGEVVWLMDELICHEVSIPTGRYPTNQTHEQQVAWLTGYPLSQTLFTSSYIDCLLWPEPKALDDASFSANPSEVEVDPLLHQVFRSYCLALIKSCDLVHIMVTSQHYYEASIFTVQLHTG
jgi:N-alpha-acetyltransferase 35, NatC auxiliary subunit